MNYIRLTWLFAGILLVLSSFSARAGVPALLEVPDYLAANVIADLNVRRADLKKRIATLQVRAEEFNKECGGRVLKPGDPAAKECLGKKADLDAAGKEYARDALAFNEDVLAAKHASPSNRDKDADSTVQLELEEFQRNKAAWSENEAKLIKARTEKPNKWCSSICASLKTKEAPLPSKTFDELQPGDVLLISPDGLAGDTIRWADRLTSWERRSPASHTVLFLKEVNGKKLFLDNTAGVEDVTHGRGPHIIIGDVFLKSYGHRGVNIAEPAVFGVAQPLNPEETAKLWSAARALGIKELKNEPDKSKNIIDKTDFGLYGDANMVCSEASHWALVNSGRESANTKSYFKKLLGVSFGPANFFSDKQNFIITPMESPK